MKRKYTEARKANRINPRRVDEHWGWPVWLRRFRGQYGGDYRDFDMKHPELERRVEGLRARFAAAQKRLNANKAEVGA